MTEIMQNSNPIIFNIARSSIVIDNINDLDNLDDVKELDRDIVTPQEVFEYIRHINDPEHPLSLEQLNVLNVEHINVDDNKNTVNILFTPTIPHCSMATLIGLCIRVKLLRSLPKRFKVTIQIYPGSHQSEIAVNKQLCDKERVAAALENNHLLDVVNKCIMHTDK
jgi:metal-sulfur cluster biosynthetic enzyme